jgi:hypothetical protein
MAVVEIVQGNNQTFTVDMAEIGTPTAVWFKVFDNKTTTKTTLYKYKYPTATGWGTLTKDGTEYSFTLTAAQTLLMLGSYGIELFWTVDSKDYGDQAQGLTVVKAAT